MFLNTILSDMPVRQWKVDVEVRPSSLQFSDNIMAMGVYHCEVLLPQNHLRLFLVIKQ